MAENTSVVCVVEATGVENDATNSFLGNLAARLTEVNREITFLFDGPRATKLASPQNSDRAPNFRRQNLGYIAGTPEQSVFDYVSSFDGNEGEREFLRRETTGFNAVEWLGAQLPVAFSLGGAWSPHPFATVADWGCRAYVGPHAPFDNDTKPFFVGGRLHLAALGPYWFELSWQSLLDPEGIAGALGQIERRVEQLASAGGALVLRLSSAQTLAATRDNCAAALLGYETLLGKINALAAQTESVRQFTDRFADISYDHPIASDFFKQAAGQLATGKLAPARYELGFLSPAEQLFGIVSLWLETIEKKKPARAARLKFPLGPATKQATSPSVVGIKGSEVESILKEIMKGANAGRFPSAVSTSAGPLALEDALATLAFGFANSLELVDLPLQRGELIASPFKPARLEELLSKREPREREAFLQLSERFLWTYKPALGL